MRKQCIVVILAVLFSVMMASTAVPWELPDSGGIPDELPDLPEDVSELPAVVPDLPEDVSELPAVVPDLIEKLPLPGELAELTEDQDDSSFKRTPSEIVRKIEKQGMELTDEYGIMRIGENGSVVTDITEETGYRWVIGNKSIELLGDGNRTISPEDLKELIGENGIVLVYTWQIGDEGIELIGENGRVPSEDLREFMENHSIHLIGTTPINSTAEESTETDSMVEESEKTDSTVEENEEIALDE